MASATLDRYRDDALYFEQHRQELLARYPECWIAVSGERVVATGGSLRRLLQQLDAAGLPRGQVFVEHLSTEEDLLILPSA